MWERSVRNGQLAIASHARSSELGARCSDGGLVEVPIRHAVSRRPSAFGGHVTGEGGRVGDYPMRRYQKLSAAPVCRK